MIEAVIAAVLISLTALTGIFVFGNDKRLVGLERFIVPLAVGIFLCFVLQELIPETLAASEHWGAIVIAAGFIGFYIIANILHRRFHDIDPENCDRKGAAWILLFGDTIHNVADGIVLGGAFLINPAVGATTALGLALHEIPQEIVEFGVLLRAGYTRTQSAVMNLISATGIIFGTLLIMLVAARISEFLWLLTGLAAGNLLFLAASDLLPRIHGNLKNYGNIWYSAAAIVAGFALMSALLSWTDAAFNQHVDLSTAGQNQNH